VCEDVRHGDEGDLKSWTRTLNIDDAHGILSVSEPGISLEEWRTRAYAAIGHLSIARSREVIRIIRDAFLEWEDNTLQAGLFLRFYRGAPAMAQVDLVHAQWALSHPIGLATTEELVRPALESASREIPLQEFDAFVATHLETNSAQSLRKTRTTVLGALESIGTLLLRGTGQHRSIRAARGELHPLVFGYLIHRDLAARGTDGMMASEAADGSLGRRLSQCHATLADDAIAWCSDRSVLLCSDDEVRPGVIPG
jgi:hypothetical protein